MKISEYFDSKKRESERLADELEKHMATWPETKRQFDAFDAECIAAARQWNDARAADSPTQFQMEAELKAARMKRDGLKHRFAIRRDELHRELAKINKTSIDEFAEYGLNRLRNLSDQYTPEKLDSFRSLDDDRRVRYTIRVSHNGLALAKCRDRIIELRVEIADSLYLPLSVIEKRIAEARREIEFFDLSATEIEEVGESRASDLLRLPEPAVSAGTMFLDGPGCRTFLKNPDLAGPRLKNLESKISNLEKSL